MREGWRSFPLDELCVLVKGTSPTQKTPPGPYPLIVTAATLATSDEFQLDGEAVCVPLVSSTGHGHASIKRLHYASGRFALANIMAALSVKNSSICDTQFLWLLLQHKKDELIVPKMKGTANVSLSLGALGVVVVDLPPLTEQRRIVDLIGSVDEAIEAADAVRLESNGTAQALREGLAGENRPLSEILHGIDAGKSPVGEERRPRGMERAVLKVSAIGVAGFHADQVKVVLAETELPEKSRVRAGDLLMVRANGAVDRVGATCRVGEVPENYFLCDKTLRLRPRDDVVIGGWLDAALRSSRARDQIVMLAGGSEMRNITQSSIMQIEIPCPSLEQQSAAVVLISVVESAANTSAQLLRSLSMLRGELLTTLLSGTHEIPASYDRFLEASAA